MTLPTSGSISASDIRDEFGPTTESGEQVALGEYRIDENYGELTERPLDDGIPQSGAISFQDFRGKKLNVIVDYYTSKYADYTRDSEGEEMNIRDRFTGGAEVHVVGGFKSYDNEDSSETKVIVHVNRKLGGQKSGDAAVCALRTGSGWEGDTEMIIDVGNEGAIYGAGGNGGRGGDTDAAGDDGQTGTSGLGISLAGVEVNVAGSGKIRAGFGGGGGGGSGRQRDKGDDRRAGGGGGGGGQGFPAGNGGAEGSGNGGEAGPGTNGSLNEHGEGGERAQNASQAYGGDGGEGGMFNNEADDGDPSGEYGKGEGGGDGAAIRVSGSGSFQLSKASGAEVDGSTSATGVS